MIKMFLVLLPIFFTGCANIYYETHTPYANVGIDDEFHEEVLYFEGAWGHQVTNTSIIFVDSLDKNILADATRRTSELKALIRVDKSKWLKNRRDAYRLILILHELGHATLLRGHTAMPSSGEGPYSIMQPFLSNTLVSAFERDPDMFINELFERNADSAELTWECRD